MPHTKPTKEELEAQMKQALEAQETQEAKPEEVKKVEETKEIPDQKEVVVNDPSKEEIDPEVDPEKEVIKKKLSNSAREAQVLELRTRKYDEAVEAARNIAEPTDDDMAKELGRDEWEELTPLQKTLAKKAWVSDKRFEIMAKAADEGKDAQKWNQQVDTFLDDPKNLIKYPELEGKQDDFKAFAAKPSRRGLDMEDLILAFNGDVAKNKKPASKGRMFEVGTAGANDKPAPKDDKLSPQQAALLQKQDFKKYKELLVAGKIRFE